MKPFAKVFGTMLGRPQVDSLDAQRHQLYREWDLQRSLAISASDRAEIDAIFSRHL